MGRARRTSFERPEPAMKITPAQAQRAQTISEAGAGGFVALVRWIGLDPATAFRGANLRGINFRSDDLRGFDFSGADLTGANLRKRRA